MRLMVKSTGLVAAIMATLILSSGIVMAGTNVVTGFTDTFENYADGEAITSTTNDPSTTWVAADASFMVATSMPVNTATYKALPDAQHTRVAQLNTSGGYITNHLAGSDVDSVWLDMNIQMVPSDTAPSFSTNDTDVQAAMYLGANGLLNFYHSSSSDGSTFGSNVFSELSHTAVETGSWHRLTVAMDYKTSLNNWSVEIKFAQITLDGNVISNEAAWVNPANPFEGTSNGTWFVCANQSTSSDHINMALLSGTGYLDDFVVTNGAPTQVTTTYYTNGVPSWWLAGYNLAQENSSTGALANADLDEYDAWAEWLLGTDPTVSNSFQVMVESNGGTNWVKWVANGTMDPNAPDILLKKSTNLLEGFTSTQTISRSMMTAGTNTWEDTGGNAMYRLGVIAE